MPTVTVDEAMLLSAVRYALGRATYIVQDTANAVRNNLDVVSYNQLLLLWRDIASERGRVIAAGGTLGFVQDDRVWVELLNELSATLERRIHDAPTFDSNIERVWDYLHDQTVLPDGVTLADVKQHATR